MIQSMTGFGSAEKGDFRVEIRSINHRFTDISIKLLPFLNEHEIVLRNMLKEKFSRGKFDVQISLRQDSNPRLKVNVGLAREIYNSLNSLRAELSIPGTIGIEALLNYRELLIGEDQSFDISALYDAFRSALHQLEKMRMDEGKAMAEDMLMRIERLSTMQREIVSLIPEISVARKQRYNDRIKELFAGVEYNTDRILQEAAIIIEKADITEELTRIDNHLKQFRKILSDGDTIGKKMDFLLQELNRETNTIASKTDDHRLSNIVIEMKSEIEKIREQVQNIQ